MPALRLDWAGLEAALAGLVNEQIHHTEHTCRLNKVLDALWPGLREALDLECCRLLVCAQPRARVRAHRCILVHVRSSVRSCLPTRTACVQGAAAAPAPCN